jgi:hypothetical protein
VGQDRRPRSLRRELDNGLGLAENHELVGKAGEKHELERVSSLEEHEKLSLTNTER